MVVMFYPPSAQLRIVEARCVAGHVNMRPRPQLGVHHETSHRWIDLQIRHLCQVGVRLGTDGNDRVINQQAAVVR